MRLLNPSPGEMLDRLTILELKIGACQQKEKDSSHFEAEKAMLQERMVFWDSGVTAGTDDDNEIKKHKNGLQAVNALLWAAEDDVRLTNENEAFKLARLCKQIAALNDSRSYHVAQLNAFYQAETGQEKIYARRVLVADQELGQ